MSIDRPQTAKDALAKILDAWDEQGTLDPKLTPELIAAILDAKPFRFRAETGVDSLIAKAARLAHSLDDAGFGGQLIDDVYRSLSQVVQGRIDGDLD